GCTVHDGELRTVTPSTAIFFDRTKNTVRGRQPRNGDFGRLHHVSGEALPSITPSPWMVTFSTSIPLRRLACMSAASPSHVPSTCSPRPFAGTVAGNTGQRSIDGCPSSVAPFSSRRSTPLFKKSGAESHVPAGSTTTPPAGQLWI